MVASSQPKIPEVCIYMDGVLLRGNRTVKVSNKINISFNSPKCQPLAFTRRQIPDSRVLEYHLDHMMHHDELSPTEFRKMNPEFSSIGIIHLFPSIPASQVKAQLEDSNMQG